MIRTFFSATLIAAALSGCSLFSDPSQKDWNRASGGSDQTSADLSACRQQARALVERDTSINNDIAAARTRGSDPETTADTLIPGIGQFDRQQRHDRIVNDCMRQRGYVLPEKQSIFE
jgi:hypothetical protein